MRARMATAMALTGLSLMMASAAMAQGVASPPGTPAAAPDSRAYLAQPLTTEIFLADPSAHVFDGRIYVYGSHDIEAPAADDQPGKGYAMRDYRVLSMRIDGGDVRVHPVAFAVEDVPWADRQLWAPDAARINGRYQVYFPAKDHEGVFRIGVAVGDRPEGPFRPEAEPIAGAFSIDPGVFVDQDGAAYLYAGGIHGGQLQRWATGVYDPAAGNTDLNRPDDPALAPRVARLTPDGLALAEPVREVLIVDEAGKPLKGGDLDRRFFEAAWVHHYGGLYYLSYSTGETHNIAYATSTSPYGPFTWRGVILKPVEGWTTHHSVVEVEGRWKLFYHDTQGTNRNTLRSAKWTDLVHEADGTIRTIDPFVAAAP